MVLSMKPTHINLKARQIKELKALSAEIGATVAELVRRAVDSYITERRKAAKESADHGKSKQDPQDNGGSLKNGL